MDDGKASDENKLEGTTEGNTKEKSPAATEEMGACGGCEPSAGSSSAGVSDKDKMEVFTVVPLTWCPHLEKVTELPARGLDTSAPCVGCGNVAENWVCLTCYEVHCSRYVNEHMLMHSLESEHKIVLSYADLSVWCYACDSYVHNEILSPAKQSAHMHKFGEAAPGR